MRLLFTYLYDILNLYFQGFHYLYYEQFNEDSDDDEEQEEEQEYVIPEYKPDAYKSSQSSSLRYL